MNNENLWLKYDEQKQKDIFLLAREYQEFISNCKTERECIKEFIKQARNHGFYSIDELNSLKPGDKVYKVNMNKSIALFVIGKNLEEGMNVLGAHIDSPRLDLKPNPVYESEQFCYLDTHYYGGIKKYQWLTIPLSIHGVVVKKDGTKIELRIGENETDPVVGITDLLPHLASEQLKKLANEFIDGEAMDVLIGSIPNKIGKEDSKVKTYIINILKEQYDFEEKDFLSAEIEIVPAFKARDFGLDRSMIIGYGQDDRICAYASFKAILNIENPERTSACLLVDKEEIGSYGATGMQSTFFHDTVAYLLELQNKCTIINIKRCLNNSKVLSSDVNAGYDPLYENTMEKKNASYLNKGVVFNKYTGARGKSGSSDANAEYIAKLRKILDEDNITYQMAELGKVDLGGGGTIAYMLSNYNMEVVDCGVSILSMHAPYEVSSKADLYEAYQAYQIFLNKMK